MTIHHYYAHGIPIHTEIVFDEFYELQDDLAHTPRLQNPLCCFLLWRQFSPLSTVFVHTLCVYTDYP